MNTHEVIAPVYGMTTLSVAWYTNIFSKGSTFTRDIKFMRMYEALYTIVHSGMVTPKVHPEGMSL